jgi:hypothetical protein
VWLILVILLPDVGSVAWLMLGRPQKARWHPGSTRYSTRRRPIAVEDRPDFPRPQAPITDRRSAELDRVLDRWEAERGDEPGPAGREDSADDD